MVRIFHLLLVLGVCPSRGHAGDSLAELARRLESRHAHGVYIGDAKVGWVTMERRIETIDGVATLLETVESIFGGATDDGDEVYRESAWRRYRLEGEGELVECGSNANEDGTVMVRVGRRAGDRLVVASETRGHRRERTIAAPSDTLRQIERFVAWLASEPPRGATFEMIEVDLEKEEGVLVAAYEYLEKRVVSRGGADLVAYDLATTEDQVEGRELVLWDGTPLQATYANVFEIRLQEEEEAKVLEFTLDFLDVGCVAVDRRLGDPEAVTYVRMILRGAEGFEFPTSARQVVAFAEDGDVIVDLRALRPSGEGSELASDERERHLRATDILQSDHERIAALAEKVVAGLDDPFARAEALLDWVFETLDGAYAQNAPTALDVLENGGGDCTEHAILFVALARAAGVPAREVGGLVYADDDVPTFGWHAWAEIHDGRHWIAMDPTFGEPVADATHLMLQEGDDDGAWTKLLGRVEIEIVDFRREE